MPVQFNLDFNPTTSSTSHQKAKKFLRVTDNFDEEEQNVWRKYMMKTRKFVAN